MTRDALCEALGLVDWSALGGAYGASDGSARTRGRLEDGTPVEVVLGDVPEALATLATEHDQESDAWLDAMEVLSTHVWHQGDIYEVTPHVIPLLFQLLALPEVAGRRELAGYLVLLAEAAQRYEASRGAARHALGRRVNAALEAEVATVAGWLEGELDQEAVFLAVHCTGLRGPVLAALERRERRLPFFVYAALALHGDPPTWVRQRAVEALSGRGSLEALAAAALLARCGEVPEALRPRLDAILSPDASARLVEAIEMPFFELAIPEIRAPFQGSLIEATVLFGGPKVVVARTGGGDNLTLHWPASGVSTGDVVLVGLSPHGEPRAVEWKDASGETHRVELRRPAGDRII